MLLPSEIEGLLREDVPYLDLTSRLLGVRRQPARMALLARHAGVAAGLCAATDLLRHLVLEVENQVEDGEAILPGATLLTAWGEAGALHMGYRQAINLVASLSGIASATRALAETAQAINPEIRVVVPRQSFPGSRHLVASAVVAGGGWPYRLGLSETVVIGREHLQFIGGIQGLTPRLERLRRDAGGKRIAVEAQNETDAIRLARAGVDVVVLNHMPLSLIADLAKTLHRCAPQLMLAAEGDIGPANIALYAASGVDLLVTSTPMHAAPASVEASWSMAQPLHMAPLGALQNQTAQPTTQAADFSAYSAFDSFVDLAGVRRIS